VTVGFYHFGQSPIHIKLAKRLADSVQRQRPGVEVRGFGQPGPIALRCLEAYAAAGDGHWLFVDTDTEIRSDVRHVFEDQDEDFDIAVATRAGTLLEKEVGTKFMAANGYNKGAVFSRDWRFWAEAADLLRTMSVERQNWMGDQLAMNRIIESGRYRVKVLPNAYNYPPKSKTDDVREKHILHFKGPSRKQWALDGCFA
jgi:hypothetical protein